jgi:hypothetical protein
VKLSRNAQTLAGFVLMVAGAYAVHEAWEGSGSKRPFLLRLLPG